MAAFTSGTEGILMMTKAAFCDLMKRVGKTGAVAAGAVYYPSLMAAAGSGAFDELVDVSLAGKAAVVGLAVIGTTLLGLVGVRRGNPDTAELFEK
jgi:hypothetical protein